MKTDCHVCARLARERCLCENAPVKKGDLHGQVCATSDDGLYVKVRWDAPAPTWESVAELER